MGRGGLFDPDAPGGRLATSAGPQSGRHRLERLRLLATTIKLSFSDDLTIRFSAGVTSRAAERTLDDLVAEADLALFRAKDHGRDATYVYPATGDAAAPEPEPAFA